MGLTQLRLSLLHSLDNPIKASLELVWPRGRAHLFQAHCACPPQLTNYVTLAHHQHGLCLEEPTATLLGQWNFVSNCISVEIPCSQSQKARV